MEIEVKGHSGCDIEIVNIDNILYIEKETRDKNYINRLYNQAIKQQVAAEHDYQFIRIPCIINIDKTESKMLMRMEYVYSKNYIHHFESAGFEQINYFIYAFSSFIMNEINSSPITKVQSSVIKNKFQDVKNTILTHSNLKNDIEIQLLLETSEKVFDDLPETLNIPVGICHGDLTFSNILFNGNNYYLIDFLDSFIESPLIDIVKLRQDSAFHWSTLMYSKPYDKTRLKIIASTIDSKFDEMFVQYEWYTRYYDMFQLMNFLRILQYAQEEKVINYLKETLTNLLKK